MLHCAFPPLPCARRRANALPPAGPAPRRRRQGQRRPRAVCRRRAPLCPVPPAACVLLPVYQKLRKCASPAPQALFPAAGCFPHGCCPNGLRRSRPVAPPAAGAVSFRQCRPPSAGAAPMARAIHRQRHHSPLALSPALAAARRRWRRAPACRQRRPIGLRAWGTGRALPAARAKYTNSNDNTICI